MSGSEAVEPARPVGGGGGFGGFPRALAFSYLLLCSLGLAAYLLPSLFGSSEAGGWANVPLVQKDSEGYMAVAQDIKDGSLDVLHDRTVGYPLLLAATGSAEKPSKLLYLCALLLHFSAIWLMGALLHAAGTRPAGVLIFGIVMALPPLVEPAAYVMTENLSQAMLVFGVAGVVWGVVRRRIGWIAAGGLCLAYAGLVHPTYQAVSLTVMGVLGLVWICLPWARISFRDLGRAVAVMLAGLVLVMGVMFVKNKVSFGFFGLTPFTGLALTTKTVRVVERLPDEYAEVREVLVAARNADLVKEGSSHTAVSYIWRVKHEVTRITGLDGVELSGYLVKLNLTLIKSAPLAYVQDVFFTAAALWTPTAGQGMASLGLGPLQALWAALDMVIIGLFFLQLMVVGGATVLMRFGRFRAGPGRSLGGGRSLRLRALIYSTGLGVVFYTTAICSLVGPGIVRYRAPVMMLVVVVTVLGLEMVTRFVRGPGRRVKG